jgi:hypothetical protein
MTNLFIFFVVLRNFSMAGCDLWLRLKKIFLSVFDFHIFGNIPVIIITVLPWNPSYHMVMIWSLFQVDIEFKLKFNSMEMNQFQRISRRCQLSSHPKS